MRNLILASLLTIGCSQLEGAKQEVTQHCEKAKDALVKAKDARDKLCAVNLDVAQAKELCANESFGELETQVRTACGIVENLK